MIIIIKQKKTKKKRAYDLHYSSISSPITDTRLGN